MKAVLRILTATSVAALTAMTMAPPSTMAAAAPLIPLCPGLTIVTAVNQSNGDYESIKTVEAVNDTTVRLRYSVERLMDDLLSSDGPKLEKFTLARTVRRSDLDTATLYLQQFSTELPELVPETTAIGTSRDVLNALKSKGESPLGIFIPFTQEKPSIDRNAHPNVYDNQMESSVSRVGTATVPFRVIVNDVPTELPAVQARGDFYGDDTEFFFLDDPSNPLTLKYRFGIGGIKPEDPEWAKSQHRAPHPGGDKDVLQVVKITVPCGIVGPAAGRGAAPGAGAGAGAGALPAGGAGGSAIEQALASSGKVDIYSIYFSFNSDVIRDESTPALKEIAAVLARHPEWKLTVNGHTDGIGTDQYNLDLSRRRAAAVKTALTTRFSVDGSRLSTSGYGKAQPKETNDTLEGRARNRRVELIRTP